MRYALQHNEIGMRFEIAIASGGALGWDYHDRRRVRFEIAKKYAWWDWDEIQPQIKWDKMRFEIAIASEGANETEIAAADEKMG